jgi:hypothetical protein
MKVAALLLVVLAVTGCAEVGLALQAFGNSGRGPRECSGTAACFSCEVCVEESGHSPYQGVCRKVSGCY